MSEWDSMLPSLHLMGLTAARGRSSGVPSVEWGSLQIHPRSVSAEHGKHDSYPTL
jgi:hypothetical protein